jgi:hypothetical protein
MLPGREGKMVATKVIERLVGCGAALRPITRCEMKATRDDLWDERREATAVRDRVGLNAFFAALSRI